MKIWKISIAYTLSFLLMIPIVLSIADSAEAGRTYVKGHYRNGKWVKPHYRNTGPSSYSGYTSSFHSNRYLEKYNKNGLVYVSGYFRDGSYVRPHWRTHPNGIITDNLSYQGISLIPPLEKNTTSNQVSNTTNKSPNGVTEKTRIYANVKDIKSYLDEKGLSVGRGQSTVLSNYVNFLFHFDPNNLGKEEFGNSHPAVKFYREIAKATDSDTIALSIAQDIAEINGLPEGSILEEPIILWADFENETLYPMSDFDSKSVQNYLIKKLKSLGLRGLTEDQIDNLRDYIFHLTMFKDAVEYNFTILMEHRRTDIQIYGKYLYISVGLDEARAISLANEDINHYE